MSLIPFLSPPVAPPSLRSCSAGEPEHDATFIGHSVLSVRRSEFLLHFFCTILYNVLYYTVLLQRTGRCGSRPCCSRMTPCSSARSAPRRVSRPSDPAARSSRWVDTFKYFLRIDIIFSRVVAGVRAARGPAHSAGGGAGGDRGHGHHAGLRVAGGEARSWCE